MTGLSLALVLLSAVAHASWNLLLKYGRNQEVFVWWLQIAIIVLLAPVAAIIVWQDPIEGPGWWFVIGTSLLHVLYFLFLSRGYVHADLSLVYPLARGTGPALVPVLGVVLLDERVSGLAIAGITAIVGGVFTRIHRCGAALGLEQGVRAVGRDGPRSIPINGAGGGLWLSLGAPMAVLGSGAVAGSAGQYAGEDNRGPGRCDSVGRLGSLVDGSGAVGAVRQAMAGLAIEPWRE